MTSSLPVALSRRWTSFPWRSCRSRAAVLAAAHIRPVFRSRRPALRPAWPRRITGVAGLGSPLEGGRQLFGILLTGDKLDAQEAWRLGLVNRVVPSAELMARARELAERVALVPPQTAQIVKDSLNQTADLMGQRQSWKYHFMVHQWMSNTDTALSALEQRKQKGSMKEVFAEHEGDQPQP